MIASSVCAAHCAVSALLPAAFGVLGLGFLVGHEAEWIFTAIAVTFAAGALGLGWRRHRSALVALLLVLGIGGLLASRLLEGGSDHHGHHDEGSPAESTAAGSHEAESSSEHRVSAEESSSAGTVVGVLAGLLLLGGHLVNLRAMRRNREECA